MMIPLVKLEKKGSLQGLSLEILNNEVSGLR